MQTRIENTIEKPATKYTIQSVERAMLICDYIAQKGKPVSVSEISVKLGINTNMAHRLLQTMTGTGFLVQDPETNKYCTSLKTLHLGRIALNSLEIRQKALPYVEGLWREIREANVNLAILEGRNVVVLDRMDGNCLPRTYFFPGKAVPIHASALGKILLCESTEEEVARITGRKDFPRFTQNTIITFAAYIEELEKARQNRIAWDREEQIPNSNCVAAPILNGNSKIIAAVSISSYDNYMPCAKLEAFIPRMKETAHSISVSMGLEI